ncbi:MAG: TlpA family protein disulfide reductase [Candidatus Zixiibacteriota bacterium]
MWRLFAAVFALVILSGAGKAKPSDLGILGLSAPNWSVEQWINLPGGEETLDIEFFQGKVLYLYCFQSWCPGCHRHGFPTLRQVMSEFGDDDRVAFVAVQTAFEGFHVNDFRGAVTTADRYDLTIPVGHTGSQKQPSQLMKRYRTGGTPWTIIIDAEGMVQYNDFHIDPDKAVTLMNRLVEHEHNKTKSPSLPQSRAGRDMIGKRLSLDGLHFISSEDKPIDLADRVTFVRWWTDTCPYCAASLPAIESLRERFADTDVRAIAVYHPKPPHTVSDDIILKAARARGYSGPVAVDSDWSVLEREYLDGHSRQATSVSFLLDREGVVRYVHPGPEFQPSDAADKRQENADYNDIAAAIQMLLQE